MAELNLPAEIHAGDTLQFTDSVAEYPAGDGWVLTYSLVNSTTRHTISGSGSDHSFDIPMATTAAWTPGDYQWVAFVVSGSERFTVGTGRITIRPDVLTTPADGRTHAEKVLTALEALLEGRAGRDHMAVTINGRAITRMPITDLIKWRDQYRAELRRIQQAERIARGEGLSANQIRVRFC